MLNHPHKPSRNTSEEERLIQIKDSLTSLKDKIVQNMVQRDHCTEETFFYLWSGIDLVLTDVSTDDRMSRMNDLLTIFYTEKVHLVKKYSNKNETQTEPNKWHGYDVYLHQPKMIHCDVEKLKKQTKAGLEAVSSLWLKEINASMYEKRPKDQLLVWKEFLKCKAIELPFFSQLLQIMIATSPNTSPLERSYTYLQMVADKRRNRTAPTNLKVRYLIAALKIPVKAADKYGMERDRLEKKSCK